MNELLSYIEEARPDTGTTNGTIGIGLFLASEVMFFGSLVAAYTLLRSSATSWGFHLPDQFIEVTLSTLLLIGSSATISRGIRREATERSLKRFLLSSVILSLGFVLLKSVNLLMLLKTGIVPAASTANGLFYVFSVLHCIHVLGGGVWTGTLLFMWKSGHATARTTKRRGRLLLSFWLFLDMVWIAIVFLFYAF